MSVDVAGDYAAKRTAERAGRAAEGRDMTVAEVERLAGGVDKFIDDMAGQASPVDRQLKAARDTLSEALETYKADPSPDAKRWLYLAADDVKRGIGSRQRGYKRMQSTQMAARGAKESARAAYKPLEESLEDPKVWGPTEAAEQRKMNKEGWVPWIEPMGDFRKTFTTEKGAPKSMNEWDRVGQLDSKKFAGMMREHTSTAPLSDLATKTDEDVFLKGLEAIPPFTKTSAEVYGTEKLRKPGYDPAAYGIGPENVPAGRSAEEAAARTGELLPEIKDKYGRAKEALRSYGVLKEAGPNAEKRARQLTELEGGMDRLAATRPVKALAAGAEAVGRGKDIAVARGGGLLAGQAASESGKAEAQSASAFDTVAETLRTAPDRLGAWEDDIMQAAAGGDDALVAKHYELSEDSPAYRDYTRRLADNKDVRPGKRGKRAYSGTFDNQ